MKRLTIALLALGLVGTAASPAAHADVPLPTLRSFGPEVLESMRAADAAAPPESHERFENHDAREEELTFEERHADELRTINQDDDSVHYARGHTLVCHVFINHDGGNWEQSEKDAAGAKGQIAKDYYTTNAPAEATVMFDNGWSNVYYSYEVTLPGTIVEDGMANIITEIALANLGFTDADVDGYYIDDASLSLQTVNGGFDNVIMIFQPADVEGRAFASYEFGRAIQYTDDMGSVWAHEWGHLFGSCDEYEEDGTCGGGMDCGACQSWYVDGLFINGNCEVSGCPSSVECLMINNTFNNICEYTLGHWAWRDTDQNGQLDKTRRRVFMNSFADVWELWHDGFFRWDETVDGMAYHQSDPSWAVVGLRSPAAANFDLHVFGDNNYENLYASSTYSSSPIDFVVGDYNHNNLGVDHVLVSEVFHFAGDYNLTWESGNQMLYSDGIVRSGNWSTDQVVRVWDVPLYGGDEVKFTLTPSSGLDLGMALFDSNGGGYWVGRAGSAWEQDSGGNGAVETYYFQVPSDDVYGLVIWSNAEVNGSYDIQVGPTPTTMSEEVAYGSPAPLSLYNYDPNAPTWSVVGNRPAPGSETRVTIYSDKNYENELESSRHYLNGVEFIVADHNVLPTDRTYVRSNREAGAGTMITQWEHDADFLPGIVGGSWASTDVCKVWDASMEAGQEYFLRGYHNWLDSALFLFTSTPYYQNRLDHAMKGDSNPPSVGGEWFKYTSPSGEKVGIVQIAHGPSVDTYQNWWGPRFYMSNDVQIARLDQVVWGVHNVPAGYWNVFAARDSTTTGNISLYGDEACSLSELKATDQSSDSNVTYVVGDFNHSPAGQYFTRSWHDNETDLDIEWEGGNEVLVEVHGSVVESPQTWPEGDVAEIWDLWLYNSDTGGTHTIYVQVEPLVDEMDLDVALFQSDHATFFGDPTHAIASSENEGPGQIEAFYHQVRTEDWYGLVVTNRSDRGGDYIIRIGPAESVGAPRAPEVTEFSFSSAPNPFRGSSSLEFSLTREQPVDLAVYDVTGRMVRRVVSETLGAGSHARTWDGRDGTGQRVAAGVYLARLRTEAESRTQKLIRLP